MVTNKHSTAIVIVITAIAVALCFLAMGFSGSLKELMGGDGVSQAYEYQLFDTDKLIRIDIQMDEEQWNDMLSNAMTEVYYVCDVVINGQKLKNVAIRPKGNTSLSAIAMDPDNDRYSFKLEFDQYVKGQTCFGLDKLVLNNNYADATNMKEAIVYDMFQYLGADASLYNYAEVSVNGAYWGIYLALEAVEDSFMLRNYGTQAGEMYKPDTMDMGDREENREGESEGRPAFENEEPSEGDSGGSDGNSPGGPSPGESAPDANQEGMPEGVPADFQLPEEAMPADAEEAAEAGTEVPGEEAPGEAPAVRVAEAAPDAVPEEAPPAGQTETKAAEIAGAEPDPGGSAGESNGDSNGGEEGNSDGEGWEGGGDSRGNGTNLNYTDDDLDSYSQIWASEITKTTDSDHRRVVTALKNISEGNHLETYMDVDNLLRYMAAHEFFVNMDSLSGNMTHNYYLYEYEGQLNIIPWDYNLALGGMGMGNNASDMINDAIDTPFSGTRFFDTLLENEEYREQYHAYLRQLVEEYVKGGAFDAVYTRIRSQIDELVRTDPNALYTYDQYDYAAGMLYRTMNLRADSIEGQLNGTIPSTDAGQRQDPSSLIDASEIDVSSMGSFSMGGGMGGGFDFGNNGPDSDGESAGGRAEGAEDAGSSPGQASGNEAAEEAAAKEPEQEAEAVITEEPEQETTTAKEPTVENANGESAGGPGPVRDFPGTSVTETRNNNVITYAIGFGIVVLAVIVVSLFRRRR